MAIIEAADAIMLFVLGLVVMGIPVRDIFPDLPEQEAVLASVLSKQLGLALISMVIFGFVAPIWWGQLIILAAGIVWLILRPGRGPLIAILAYEAFGALLSLLLLFRNPWGSQIQKAAATALLVHLAISYLLVLALRAERPSTLSTAPQSAPATLEPPCD